MLKYDSIQELINAAAAAQTTLGSLILKDQARQMELSEEEIYRRMDESFSVMEQAVQKGFKKTLKSTSGLTGGDAYIMKEYAQTGGICGTFMTSAMARAIAVSEYNAAMGKIVAAPTAGSCGIMPGCLVSLLEDKGIEREKIIYSMFTAAGFGIVIAKRASIAGAQGGCQAECGAAAAMAAAALVEIYGGSPAQAGDACAIALKNQLGLVCDPVAGLVEIPCIKRNVAGIMIAFSSADMALAGISSKIPVDEVVDAMKEVGDALPCSLKETAKGGLANTPTGKRMTREIFGKTED
ncbi:MAG: L-serine ammonia-lyase, iron-sulfur-dependent, subunit alpha [Schaedlerella sp.]|nr:L-serine ammonia-lyase, iron-sulfur-dependent, subunit alpha [Schaedlerella sp.]